MKRPYSQKNAAQSTSRPVLPFSSLAQSQTGGLSVVLPGRSTTPSRVAIYSERAELMETALRALPAEQQDVVRLYLFEELPMDTIAKRLGVAASTAWYRFRRGSEAYAGKLKLLRTASNERPDG